MTTPTIYVPASDQDFAHWGGHNTLLEAWWSEVLKQAEKSPKLVEAERVIEAETKIDFASWLFGYAAAAFYQAYEQVDSQWRLYAGLKELPNFNEFRIKGRNPLQGFGYIGDHAHSPGTRRSYRPEASLFIDTYGAQHEYTRQSILNGNIEEILREDPEDMGTEAGIYLANAVIALMTSNPTAPDGGAFFSSGRGNLVTTELSGQTLMDAWTAFQTRRDAFTNRPIRITPRRLIVQNRTWASIVLREIQSTNAAGQVTNPANAATVRGTDNPVSKLPWPEDFVMEEPFLPDFNDAYMIADPNKYPAWLVGMLQGTDQKPQLYQSQPEMQAINGGITSPYQLRIRKIRIDSEWDIGVAAVNPDVAYAWRPA
jgi:hypothetical protein